MATLVVCCVEYHDSSTDGPTYLLAFCTICKTAVMITRRTHSEPDLNLVGELPTQACHITSSEGAARLWQIAKATGKL